MAEYGDHGREFFQHGNDLSRGIMTLVMASGGERRVHLSVLWTGFKPVTLEFAETTAL